MLALEKFIKEHENWEELLTKDPYNLIIRKDAGYILFKYNQLSSNFNLPEVREARGIIFREDNLKCVCHPFNKFFNYGESYADSIDWESAITTTKVDGTLIKVWFDDGWHISTNGTIDANKAFCNDANYNSFYDVFVKAFIPPYVYSKMLPDHDYNTTFNYISNFLDKHCNKDCTYMFELVSPATQVVISYPEEKLYLIGIRNNNTHQEVDVKQSTLSNFFEIPKRYMLNTLKAVVDAADALNAKSDAPSEEGFVVVDKNFNRIKVKNFKYLIAHHKINNHVVTITHLIELILTNDYQEFLVYLPQYESKLSAISNGIKQFKSKVKTTIAQLKPETFADKKSYAEVVKQYPQHMQQFLFAYNNLKNKFDEITVNKWEYILKQEGVC